MSNKVTVAELVSRNKHIAATTPPQNILLSEFPSKGMVAPQVLIITCADPRCDPSAILGLKAMETVVFRNPCGHVAPDVNGLLALDILLGGFEEVMIIHHTDCGTTMFTDDVMRQKVKESTGSRQSLDSMAFGAIASIEQSVKDDLAFLKEHPFVRKQLKEKAVGFVYDIQSGLLTQVQD